MLIRNFSSAISLENNELADCGILKYKRVAYLFVDPDTYNNGIDTNKATKAVIINSSVSKGSKEGNIVHIAIDNSVIIRFTVYFCNVVFEEPSHDINLSQFTVENAYSKEVQSLFDQKRSTHFMIGMYSSALGKLASNDTGLFWSIIENMDSSILPPIYYTEMHQYKSVGDLFTLSDSLNEIFSGREIIDNKTTIKHMNLNLWDTIKYNFLGVINHIENRVEVRNTLNSLDNFYNDFIDFIGDDCYFIYDSDGKGINNPGTNIIKGSIPYKPYYVDEHIRDNVTTTLTFFEQSCHNIERDYGHVRIQCYPNKIGNKTKIRFKDYDNTPKEFCPLGKIEFDGTNNSSSDNGFHIKRQIDESLDYLIDDRLYS